MEWFLVWNGIGLLAAVYKLINTKDLGAADVLFIICFIPWWPILLYMTRED